MLAEQQTSAGRHSLLFSRYVLDSCPVHYLAREETEASDELELSN